MICVFIPPYFVGEGHTTVTLPYRFFRVVFLFWGLDTKVLIATLQYYIRKGSNVKNADTISIVLALCNVQDKLI